MQKHRFTGPTAPKSMNCLSPHAGVACVWTFVRRDVATAGSAITYVCACVCALSALCVCMYVCMCECVCLCIYYIYIYIYIYICTRMNCLSPHAGVACVWTFVRRDVATAGSAITCVYIFCFVCVYARICVCVYIYICTYIHIYIYMHTYELS